LGATQPLASALIVIVFVEVYIPSANAQSRLVAQVNNLSARKLILFKGQPMGDRSPKSNQKIASQKKSKTDEVDKRRKADIARGQQAKTAMAAKGKK